MNKRVLSKEYQAIKNSLTINCKECSALCCVALYCNKIDGFPENKSAGIPCKYLETDFKCKIYTQLDSKHLKGCVAYDCFGAGQKATKLVKPLGNWKTNQNIKKDFFNVFEKLRLLNQMMWYLLEAYTYCDDTDLNTVISLIHQNSKITQLDLVDLNTENIDEYRLLVNKFLKSITLIYALDAAFVLKNSMQMGKDFTNQNLDRSNLSMACLIASNLESCRLIDTNFLGTDLRDVNVCNADLSESLFLTQFQINSMIGNKNTKLPEGLIAPLKWNIN